MLNFLHNLSLRYGACKLLDMSSFTAVFQIICVTNFEGDERIRIKHMISSVGAKYTGYMTRANSVVLATRLVLVITQLTQLIVPVNENFLNI